MLPDKGWPRFKRGALHPFSHTGIETECSAQIEVYASPIRSPWKSLVRVGTTQVEAVGSRQSIPELFELDGCICSPCGPGGQPFPR